MDEGVRENEESDETQKNVENSADLRICLFPLIPGQ
jgi:hypothetical protein